MLELLRERRSIRVFSDRPVEKDKLRSLLEAGLLAPSSMGKKPVSFIVIEDRAVMDRLKTYKRHGTLPLDTAPLALVVLADKERSDVWVEDASIASLLIQLEAEKLGLASTWIQLRLRAGETGPSEELFRRELHIPDHFGVLSVIALGYKNEDKPPHDESELDFSKVHYGTFTA